MTDQIREAAREVVECAFSGDRNASVVVLPWKLIWDLKDALDADEAPHRCWIRR